LDDTILAKTLLFFEKKGFDAMFFIWGKFSQLGKKKMKATKCTKDFFGKNKLKLSQFQEKKS
jgi:hypothetical protein